MKLNKDICCIVLSLMLLSQCQSSNRNVNRAENNRGVEVVERIEPSDGNPRNSEGDFIQLKDGRILFVYSRFVGEKSTDHTAAYLAGRWSADGGNSWSDDRVVVEREGDMNVMSVSLLRLMNGKIALFYARKNSLSDCIPMMRISDDEAETWSEPIPCIQDKPGYYVINNDRVIQLKGGRLLMPVSLHKARDEAEWSRSGRLWSYYSDDNGETWHSSTQVPNPTGVLLQEPGAVEMKDGRVMMFIRSDANVQYVSFSSDQGKTWSPARPGNIPSPLSPASIERIPSTGDLLLIWNNNGGEDPAIARKRTPFNSAISKDEGQSWINIRTIANDPDGWYCYTAIHFSSDDEVLLGHCAGNRPKGTGLSVTNITRLSLDWIYGQNSSDDE